MILFGDMDFFTSDSVKNKSGRRLWLGFLSLLVAGGHVYRDGLPAVCEIHKTRVDLSCADAFDEYVPDGGCRVVCGAQLPCGVRGHLCRRRCHPGDDRDHERAGCAVILEDVCGKGHTSKRRCTKDPVRPPCKTCEHEAAAIGRKITRVAETDHPYKVQSHLEVSLEELTRRTGLMFNWGGRHTGQR